MPRTGVPYPKNDLEPETSERTLDWSTPQKGFETRDLGKNLGLGYPSQKGHETRG